MAFVEVELATDPETLTDDTIEGLRTAIPGWEPADGNLEVWLIEAFSRISAEIATVAASVPPEIFRQFGLQLIGLPPLQGERATIQTTWTARDTAGHTAAAGTQVAYRVSGDTLVIFETTAPVVVPPGFDSLPNVTLTAIDVGTASNGVPTGNMEAIDPLSWVNTIAATTVSAGGVDAETDDAYLSRLAAELRLLTPRPILPEDFAVLASRIDGVARALAVSGYNPDDDTDDNERYVAVAMIDADGQAVDTTVADEAVAYLDSLREVNFVVAAMDPTYTTVNVDYEIRVATGYSGAETLAAVTAAVSEWLSPAIWAGGDQSPPRWESGTDVVRLLELASVIRAVPGVLYVGSLEINGSAANLTLTGKAPLPQAGTVTGAVV